MLTEFVDEHRSLVEIQAHFAVVDAIATREWRQHFGNSRLVVAGSSLL
jgi:hypothetical protein